MKRKINNPGFSFIEIIIVITLSALLFSVVLFLNQQTTKTSFAVDRHLQKSEQQAILYTQLFNDIAGMSILIYDKETPGKSAEEKKEPKKVELQKTKEKQTGADRYFYSENTETHLNFITFITTNTLQFYGKPKTRFTRVVYKAKKEEGDKATFTLYRKEIDSLLFDDIYDDSWQGYYPLLSGIKKLNINYYIIKENTEKKDGASDKPELIDIQEWGVSNQDGDEHDFDLKIPRFLKFTYELDNGVKEEIWFKTPLTNIHAPALPQSKPQKETQKEEGAQNPVSTPPAQAEKGGAAHAH